MDSFVIPADYCVALIDAAAYRSFVDENWTLPQIRQHFITQMNQGTMLAWGTNAPGNWRIRLTNPSERVQGYREFSGNIRATGTKLHFTSYDELTAAAQVENVRLPRKGTESWFVSVQPREYYCRVVQLYAPAEAESEEVFNQSTPHFLVEISEARGPTASAFEEVPWFVESNQ